MSEQPPAGSGETDSEPGLPGIVRTASDIAGSCERLGFSTESLTWMLPVMVEDADTGDLVRGRLGIAQATDPEGRTMRTIRMHGPQEDLGKYGGIEVDVHVAATETGWVPFGGNLGKPGAYYDIQVSDEGLSLTPQGASAPLDEAAMGVYSEFVESLKKSYDELLAEA
jgi:hypothetical protein